MRYNRHISLPDMDLDGQERLLNARVLMIGVGGLGNAAAQYLVAAGLGSLTLCDDDRVEMTNLQRQVLFAEQDVGQGKCQAAQARLQAMNSDVQITILPARLDEARLAEQIQGHDLVLDCTDNLASRNLINRLCVKQLKPLVSGAAIRLEGQLFCYLPGNNLPCYQCFSRLFSEQQLSCSEAGILAPVVGLIGIMQALEAIKILTGIGKPVTGQIQLFDAQTSQWQCYQLKPDPHCPVCASAYSD